MKEVLQIGSLSAKTGEKVNGTYLVPGTNLQMPLTLVNGAMDGKIMLITAGVHGGEYPSIAAAIQLAKELDPKMIHGAVVVAPLVNQSGFEAKDSSHVPADGKNLNRLFPGDQSGTVGDRLAWAITRDFHQVCDYNIDLHAGNYDEDLTPFVYYPAAGGEKVEETSRQMALACGVKYITRSTATTGLYNSAAIQGLPSILIERGGNGLWSQQEAEADRQDVYAVLRLLGFLEGENPTKEDPVLVPSVQYYGSEATGCWYPCWKTGDRISKGDLLGEIRDYTDEVLCRYVAEFDGVMLYQTSSLAIIRNKSLMAFGKLD